MKVAFFSHYAGLYGANRCLLTLTRGLKEFDIEPFVLLPKEGPMSSVLRAQQIPFMISPFALWVTKRRHPIRILKRTLRNRLEARRLATRLADWGAELIYSNSSAINIGALTSALLRRPHAWHVREFGDTDYGILPDWGRWHFERSLGSADAVILISYALASRYRELSSQTRVKVLYDGVASRGEFLLRRDKAHRALVSKRPGAPFTFILVGLLQPQKGQESAIRALQRVSCRVPNVRLWLVGSGQQPFVERCQVLAAELGVSEKVRFWGYVDDLGELYCEADCGLMCSQSEAFGLVTVEAMSFCRPVIGFNGGATPELVRSGQNGLLYSGGEEELASCMEKLAADPIWVRSLGENAWHSVSERFTVEDYVSEVYSLFTELCGYGRSQTKRH